jgi:hypothetical protein
MRSNNGFLLGLTLGLAFVTAVASAQPFAAQVQIAITQLTTGIIPFTALRNGPGAYVNWGTTSGVNGYGLRDNAGVIEAKNSGGSWLPVPTSATLPTDASYITRTTDANLSNEFALGSLATALLLNTTTTGVPVAYAGYTCTNEFTRGLSGVGAGICDPIDLSADVTATLSVGNGGTGLTAGTSGGVLAFTATGTLASSGALTANALVLGSARKCRRSSHIRSGGTDDGCQRDSPWSERGDREWVLCRHWPDDVAENIYLPGCFRDCPDE